MSRETKKPREVVNSEIQVEYIVGDITDPNVVGKNTAIVIPGNTFLSKATDYYPDGVQTALLKKTSPDLLRSARTTLDLEYPYGTNLNNGDMVLVDTRRVPGSEKWAMNVPTQIIFAVTMEPDERTRHRVTRESVAKTVASILTSSNLLNITEIAFPLIGTGAMGLSYTDFILGFTEGMNKFKLSTDNPIIKKIKVVVFKTDVLKLPEKIQKMLPAESKKRE